MQTSFPAIQARAEWCPTVTLAGGDPNTEAVRQSLTVLFRGLYAADARANNHRSVDRSRVLPFRDVDASFPSREV